MLKLNYETIKDKIHACWLGKNIGGTIGAPFEGTKEYLDVKGFTTPKGEPLPNDDLDLQLIWLCAMEEIGPYSLCEKDLATYWQAYIPPYWNEYGVGKGNMTGGLVPSLSGEYNNQKWRHSNGAWIRSEIWACLAPGYPEIARRYAFCDAVVDHGMGEGTVAEQFTVTLESLAFFNTDIRDIIEKALTAIPEDSRVAKAVRLVIDGFDRGDDPKTVRDALVEQSRDIGWFQAPANVGYVVLGLLYGGGDFKKSMLYTVNCGDDTDCTAATVGAFLGILNGTKGVPEDWAEYVGDRIITCSVNNSYRRVCELKTCEILTNRVMNMIPTVFIANNMPMQFTDGDSELEPFKLQHISKSKLVRNYPSEPLLLSQYNFEGYNSALLRVRAELDKMPELAKGDSVKVKLTFYNKVYFPLHAELKLILPEGIDATPANARVYIDHQKNEGNSISITLTANEFFKGSSKVIVDADVIGFPEDVLFSIPILAQ